MDGCRTCGKRHRCTCEQSTQLTVGQNSSEWPRLQVDILGGMCCLQCRSFGEVAIVGEATETADDQRFLELWEQFESGVTDHMIRHHFDQY